MERTEVRSSFAMIDSPKSTPGSPWKPSIFMAFPWPALFALLGSIFCTVACVVVLVSSNRKSTQAWPTAEHVIQPTVLLAIFAASSNALLRFALLQGRPIIWWRKMLQGGTMRDLHQCWANGESVLESIMSGRNFNAMSLANLVTALVVIQGPLLQRASSIGFVKIVHNVDISVALTPSRLPDYFTGFRTGRTDTIQLFTPEFQSALKGFNDRSPIKLNYTGCEGTCITTLKAVGFDVNCTVSRPSYDLEPIPGASYSALSTNITFFGTEDPSLISVSTSHKPDSDCIGKYVLTECSLRAAMVKYPMSINNGIITFAQRASGDNDTVALVLDLPREMAGLGIWGSTLGGIALAAQNKYHSKADFYFGGSYQVISTGSTAVDYINSNTSADGSCEMTWEDPTPDILNGIREMTFRAAIAASNSSTTQTAKATEDMLQTIYISHYKFLFLALTLPLLAVLVIIPLFFGWWELGRSVSFSPLELAKAFDAPVLSGPGSNADINRLLEVVGDRKVRYGEVMNMVPQVGKPGTGSAVVEATTSGKGDLEDDSAAANRRLTVANQSEASLPWKGSSYV
ncbi:hypothetical protein K440DRAFT_618996 [Wilcoxina mikolae CBS 423.85]|nr:hypothetical protein K440DRAFT_618996 [Wilcoxina mikolae CBS 423.85]